MYLLLYVNVNTLVCSNVHSVFPIHTAWLQCFYIMSLHETSNLLSVFADGKECYFRVHIALSLAEGKEFYFRVRIPLSLAECNNSLKLHKLTKTCQLTLKHN